MPEFDVFLCHNSQDKPEVREIARQLKQQKLKPWLDEWELRPGLPWQPELERQIKNIKSAAVFVGRNGTGPWQRMEIDAYLRRFVNQGCPVIPILLTNAPKQPELPTFLEGMTWVDFRHSESNPMGRLIWGITGIKPADLDSAQSFITELPAKFKQEKSQAQSFTEDLGSYIELKMIAIPDDKFFMGTEDRQIERLVKKYNRKYFRAEKPQHEVTVQPFFMSKYPITQEQYQEIMGKNPSHFKGDERPIENVSWDDAVEFCQRLSQQTGKKYRLPSEAEWEYACRAGTTTPYHFGDNITDKLANYGGNVGKTTPVGQFPPNAFGLYDMHGNVWEWCEDDWHKNYQDAPNDGRAWLSENNDTKVLRGGSWFDHPEYCRSATRILFRRDIRGNDVGFRVVCGFGST